MLQDLELVDGVPAVLEQDAQRVHGPQAAVRAADQGEGVRPPGREAHGRAGRRHERAALHVVADVAPPDDGVVRDGGRVHAEEALQVVVPVHEVVLEVDRADHGDVRSLGAREVEVGHGWATAHGRGRDVIGI